ncbi:DUF6850 family outer membrane beta-barrel protein [Chitinophaga alhagiae]|uniref:DUF6850 family outer membrane beta-barrel protein n=1 Tax=Chitinophaga alhagiae TaxID=2203219 RepID=UPI000E5BCA76|nr:DUF6850 family outer membrane beta-barrel protein [Chitinophaga alhagiae]
MQKLSLFLTVLASLCCTSAVHAQASGRDTLNAYEDGRLPEMPQLTRNPASLWQSDRPNYTRVAGGWEYAGGDLRRPMAGAASNTFGVAAAGYAKAGGWTYQGAVAYNKQLEQDVAWSGVYNPYEGNPFLWTDSSSGEWERDHLRVSATVNTPAFARRWHAGLNIAYHVGSGARKSDPKPFYRYRNISLAPGLTWQAGKHTGIGAYGKVRSVQEDNELGFYNTGTGNVLLYRLRGYGTYTRAPFVNAERQRRGLLYEAGGYYSYKKDQLSMLISIYGAVNEETVYEGVIKRQAFGYYHENRLGGAVSFFAGGIDRGHFAAISFDAVSGHADDVVYNARTAYSTRRQLSAKAGYWKGSTQLELCPFLQYDEFTDVAATTGFNTASAGGLLVLNWRKRLSPQTCLQLKPAAGYRHVLHDNWQQGANNVIVRELIFPDYRYFTSSRIIASVTCAYILHLSPHIAHGIEAYAGGELGPDAANKTIRLQYSILF